jgi:hypothetical protein
MKHCHRLFLAATAVVVALAVPACRPSASPTSASAAAPSKKSKAPAAATSHDAALASATDFLAEMKSKRGDSARLTTAFRNLLLDSPPRPADDALAKEKFEVIQAHWIQNVKPTDLMEALRSKAFANEATVCAAVGKDQAVQLIRLVKDGEWKIDWYQNEKINGQFPDTAMTPELFGGLAFLTSLFETKSGDTRLVAATLSKQCLASLAPVFSKADEARGYNPGTLAEKLKAFRGGATGFEITGAQGDTVKGVLNSPAGKRVFTMKLSLPNGLVDTFAVE